MALTVITRLENEGAIVRAHDPAAAEQARSVCPQVAYYDSVYEMAQGADALLVLTEWPAFKELDYAALKERMSHPCIVDARNLLDPETMRAMGFAYAGIGRS